MKSTDLSFFKALVESPFEGILAIDAQGTIVFANSFFLKLFKIPESELTGKKIWEVVPDCHLHETLIQGHSQWGELLTIKGRRFVVGRFPIKQDGRIVGALIKTVFPDMTTAKSVAKKISGGAARRVEPGRPLATCMDIVGECSSMLLAKKLGRQAARSDSTLLITGESGTGKDVLAQAVHNRSVRREGPFVKVNCAAVPESLLESELFGFTEGAFTGAKRGGKPGKFEAADRGTIFLDEIGDMPLSMQAKVLRVLQEKEIERIGSNRPILLDVRIIAATNQNLQELVRKKLFREDLYYRLKILQIHLPPLRERCEDIPPLIDCLIKKINRKIGSDIRGITPKSLELAMQYDWPGNIRELENVIEQAVNWSEDLYLDLQLPLASSPSKLAPAAIERTSSIEAFHDSVAETERDLIVQALTKTRWNKAEAARLLKIQRSVLYKKMRRLDIA